MAPQVHILAKRVLDKVILDLFSAKKILKKVRKNQEVTTYQNVYLSGLLRYAKWLKFSTVLLSFWVVKFGRDSKKEGQKIPPEKVLVPTIRVTRGKAKIWKKKGAGFGNI